MTRERGGKTNDTGKLGPKDAMEPKKAIKSKLTENGLSRHARRGVVSLQLRRNPTRQKVRNVVR